MSLVLGASLPFLNEMVALLTVSVAIAYVCFRLRLVPIVGFLLAGVVIGPNALGLVADREIVDVLAEVGVILLLFTIGAELSLGKLARLGRVIFGGGALQVGVTVAAVAALLAAMGVAWPAGLYTGCLVALSSTAIVLTLLADRAETDTPAGQLTLAVLIFQDLAIVGMVLLVPILAGEGGTPGEVAWVFAKAAALVAGVLVLARRGVPWLLERIAKTRRPELFLLTVMAVCFGTAALSSVAGVSLALGAFLAGLVVSESRYSDQALGEILPLRIVFNAVFFVSVGMLLDVGYVVRHPLLVLAAAGVVVVVKVAATGLAALVLGYPLRVTAAVALALAQIGEFSFVLERAGRSVGLTPGALGEAGAQTFIAVSVLLMLLTPGLVHVGGPLGTWLARWDRRRLPDVALGDGHAHGYEGEDHVVVVGYGPAGRHLVRVLRATGIPFVVTEMNPVSVAELEAEGLPVLYGDASLPHIQALAGVERAKLCVVVINDPGVAPRIVAQARYRNPTLQIIARTRFLSDVERLQAVGADVVVPEEMETTVRVFSHVLGAYLVPPDEIERHVRALRADDYRVLRGSIHEAHLMVLQGLDEEGLHTRAVAVRPGAPAAGQTLQALALRRAYGLTVLAVRRGARTLANPAGDFLVEPKDRLVLIGSASDFAAAASLFRAEQPPETSEAAPA